MIPYIGLLLLLIFLAAFEQIMQGKNLGILKLFIFILLACFAAFRPSGGDHDYENYVYTFELFLAPSDFYHHFSDWVFFEPFYYLIPSFYKTYLTVNNFIILSFLTFSIIAVGLKFYGVGKLSNFFFLSVLVYFTNFFFLHEMTQIRAGVAAGFLMVSVWLIVEKRYWLFTVILTVSMLFHYSSFVMLLILFLNPAKLDRPVYLGLLVVTFLLAFIDTSFIFSFLNFDLGPITFRSANYFAMSEYEGVEPINKLNTIFLISFTTTTALVFLSDRLSLYNKYAVLMLKMQVIGLLFFQLFSAIPIFSFRISELLIITQILTLPLFVYVFPNKWWGFALVVLVAACFFYINLFHLELMKSYI